MQRVLMLSDDPAQVAVADAAMRRDGRTLRSESNAEGCLLAIREWRPDLLILDFGVGLSAAGIAALLRDPVLSEGVPVLALAEHEQLRDVGAGVPIADFTMVPIDEDELRTRVSRVLWAQSGADDGHLLRRGSLVIDLERYTVTVDGGVVDLTFKEYELLRFLASNPGKPFTREALLNQVWGYDYYGGSRTVDVHVRRIRAKIERRDTFVETVRNVGYRFVDEPRG